MRKIYNILAFMLLAILINSCDSTTPKQAADYNDLVMAEQKKVVMKYDLLLKSFDTFVLKNMETAHNDFTNQIDSSIDKIKYYKNPSGTDDLKEAVLAYINTYKKVNDESIWQLINIYKMPQNEFTLDDKMTWDNTYKQIDTELKTADKQLKEAQADYAKAFNLKIQ